MSEITEKIKKLQKERNAVILAHNYQRGEVQDIADFVGDSLGLSQQAGQTDADVIIFCGVHFMAETAAMISPSKRVILPDANAGCPMANMITARELKKLKKQHPDAVVVCYVNSTAAVKAESDYCCTSSNAVKVLQAVPENKKIIFVPDKSLGEYSAKQANREVILWDGYCPTHHRILPEDIEKQKSIYPDAKVVVHPECLTAVVKAADVVASTSGILKFCRESTADKFIIGTESGILHRLRKENPDKQFYPASKLADCPNMKLTTLEKVLWALEDLEPVITVEPETARRAMLSINRMLDLS